MYAKHIQPRLLKWRMAQKRFIAGRHWCAPHAYGNVLEIGFGTGQNLPYYTDRVAKLIALEPNKNLTESAHMFKKLGFTLELVHGDAEDIPLPNNTVDCIVCTWTLCSVHAVQGVATELYRVLKPNGKIFFIEHGRSQSKFVSFLQNTLNPFWTRCSGGCNLNRSYFDPLTEAGFAFEFQEQKDTEYRGIAVKS